MLRKILVEKQLRKRILGISTGVDETARFSGKKSLDIKCVLIFSTVLFEIY
jgi:hypothetical protein